MEQTTRRRYVRCLTFISLFDISNISDSLSILSPRVLSVISFDKWMGKRCTKNVKAVKNQLLSPDLRQVRTRVHRKSYNLNNGQHRITEVETNQPGSSITQTVKSNRIMIDHRSSLDTFTTYSLMTEAMSFLGRWNERSPHSMEPSYVTCLRLPQNLGELTELKQEFREKSDLFNQRSYNNFSNNDVYFTAFMLDPPFLSLFSWTIWSILIEKQKQVIAENLEDFLKTYIELGNGSSWK